MAFERQAARSPGRVALVFGAATMTYGELDRRAALLASHLRHRGVGPDVLVGLCIERSFDLVVGMLGILKAGGAYVPIDPAHPDGRISHVLKDSQASVVVTQRSLLGILPMTTSDLLLIDELPSLIGGRDVESRGLLCETNNLAYVIYTSGSTGQPKGVQIEHRALGNFLNSMRREPGLGADDVLLAVTTVSFDISVLELLLPLTTGARVVIVPRQVAVDGEALARTIDSQAVTVFQATPATLRLLIEAGWRGSQRLRVLCGGEPLSPQLARELLLRCAELWNMYGPTETTIWSTCGRIRSEAEIHIGRTIDHTEIHILDPHLQPVPVGLVGELLIGGEGLARGYLNRPELTAEKFIPHPTKPGARLYRTGDLAKYQPDGNVVCLGRVDFQVKIRGYRIELGEIETVLTRHPGVREAVVTVFDSGPVGQQLVAYVVRRNGLAPPAADLREHLRQELPDYMLPAAFVPVDRLPLTPNGKIDRKALPPPIFDDLAPTFGQVAPRNETEAKLSVILAQVLGLERVGVTDDFFALGGHSLLAVKFFAEIERQMGRKFPVFTLLHAATVEKMADEFAAAQENPREACSLIAIQPQGAKPALYCVHGAGGNILLYRDLAAHLGKDYPVYGFQSKGLDGRVGPLCTIEEMAAHYLAELKRLQPKGPYCLAGYCLGGMVAYQMARLLRMAGDEVALVALLDTYNPSEAEKASRVGVLWQRVRFHASNLMKLRLREFSRYLGEKLRVARDGELSNLLGIEDSSHNGGILQEGNTTIGSGGDTRVQQINDRATALFRPKPYDGSVVLFKPQVNYGFMSDPRMGWGNLVKGDLDIVELPVNPHAMLVEPFVKHLAEAFRVRLDQFQLHKLVPLNPGQGHIFPCIIY